LPKIVTLIRKKTEEVSTQKSAKTLDRRQRLTFWPFAVT